MPQFHMENVRKVRKKNLETKRFKGSTVLVSPQQNT